MRLFVAAYPPPDAVDYLIGRVAELELPPHRTTPRDQIHLTLQFIGDTPESELARTLESVERATGGLAATRLRLLRLLALPARGPARLVAAETDSPATLVELHDRLESRLESRLVGRLAHDPGKARGRRYRPHLTLCRFRTPAPFLVPDNLFDESEAGAAPAFPLDELRVIRSVLRPTGAEHSVLARFPLHA